MWKLFPGVTYISLKVSNVLNIRPHCNFFLNLGDIGVNYTDIYICISHLRKRKKVKNRQKQISVNQILGRGRVIRGSA